MNIKGTEVQEGDYVKVTECRTLTHEGELIEWSPQWQQVHLKSAYGEFVVDLEEYDDGDTSFTVEKITPPLRDGWWEVGHTYTDGVTAWRRAKGAWRYSNGDPVHDDVLHITPLRFIGEASC